MRLSEDLAVHFARYKGELFGGQAGDDEERGAAGEALLYARASVQHGVGGGVVIAPVRPVGPWAGVPWQPGDTPLG